MFCLSSTHPPPYIWKKNSNFLYAKSLLKFLTDNFGLQSNCQRNFNVDLIDFLLYSIVAYVTINNDWLEINCVFEFCEKANRNMERMVLILFLKIYIEFTSRKILLRKLLFCLSRTLFSFLIFFKGWGCSFFLFLMLI